MAIWSKIKPIPVVISISATVCFQLYAGGMFELELDKHRFFKIISEGKILPKTVLGKSFGGEKDDTQTMQDGVGVMVINPSGKVGYGDEETAKAVALIQKLKLKYWQEYLNNRRPGETIWEYILRVGGKEDKDLMMIAGNALAPYSDKFYPPADNTCTGGYDGNPYVGNLHCGRGYADFPEAANGGKRLPYGWLNLKGLKGNLDLSGLGIVDLTALANLKFIEGKLDLSDNDLPNVDGLKSLEKADEIILNNAKKLTNVNGLSNLKEVNRISLINVPELEDISGLSNLQTVKQLKIESKSTPYKKKIKKYSYVCSDGKSLVLDQSGTSYMNKGELWKICEIGSCQTGFSGNPFEYGNINCANQNLSGSLAPGWSNLISMENGKWISLRENNLIDINSLSSLKKVYRIDLLQNPLLTNISGLKGLEEVDTVYLDLKNYQVKIPENALVCNSTKIKTDKYINNYYSSFYTKDIPYYRGTLWKFCSIGSCQTGFSGNPFAHGNIDCSRQNLSGSLGEGWKNLVDVTSSGFILLTGNNLTDVNSLSNLDRAKVIELSGNPNLKDISGIKGKNIQYLFLGKELENQEFEGKLPIDSPFCNNAKHRVAFVTSSYFPYFNSKYPSYMYTKYTGDIANKAYYSNNGSKLENNGYLWRICEGGSCKNGFSVSEYKWNIKCSSSDIGSDKLSAGWLNLKKINGVNDKFLNLKNANLTDISNLKNLEYVSGIIDLRGNKISNLNGLSGLRFVKYLYLNENPNLTDIKDLGGFGTGYEDTIKNSGSSVYLYFDDKEYQEKIPNDSHICTIYKMSVRLMDKEDKNKYIQAKSSGTLYKICDIGNCEEGFKDINGMLPYGGIDCKGRITSSSLPSSWLNVESVKYGIEDGASGAWIDLRRNPNLTDISSLSSISTSGYIYLDLKDYQGKIAENAFNCTNNSRIRLFTDGEYIHIRNIDLSQKRIYSSLEKDYINPANSGLLWSICEIGGSCKTGFDDSVESNPNVSGINCAKQNLSGSLGEGWRNLTKFTKIIDLGLNSLTDVDSLENLTEVGKLMIDENPSLDNIQGLKSISSLTAIVLDDKEFSVKIPQSSPLCSDENLLKNVYLRNASSLKSVYNYDLVYKVCDIGNCYEGFEGNPPSQINIQCQYKNIENLGERWSGLISVKGNLNLYRNKLTSLDKLNGLQKVGSSFRLNGNNLQDISGLSNLTEIGFIFDLRDNPNLSSLHGLEKLKKIGNKLYLPDGKLDDISALSGVTDFQTIYFGNIGPKKRYGVRLSANSLICQSVKDPNKNINIRYEDKFINQENQKDGIPYNIYYVDDRENAKIWKICDVGDCYEQGFQGDPYDKSPNPNINCSYEYIDGPLSAGWNGLVSMQPNSTLWLNNSGVTSVENLKNLTSVHNLDLHANLLTDLTGLESLQQATGTLNLSQNPNLQNVQGLSSLQTVGTIDLRDTAVASLNGLENLRTVGTAYFNKTPLTDIRAISGVTSLTGRINFEYHDYAFDNKIAADSPLCNDFKNQLFWIDANNKTNYYACDDTLWKVCDIGSCQTGFSGDPFDKGTGSINCESQNLTELTSGWNGLVSMKNDTYLNLSKNNLKNLSGLSGLKKIFNLYIDNNPSMISLSGLENLEEAYVIDARENIAITDLNPLSNLKKVHALRFDNIDTLKDISGLSNMLDAYQIVVPLPVTHSYGWGEYEYDVKINASSALCDDQKIASSLYWGPSSYANYLNKGYLWKVCDIGNCLEGPNQNAVDENGAYKYDRLTCWFKDEQQLGSDWNNLKKIKTLEIYKVSDISNLQNLGEVEFLKITDSNNLASLHGLEGLRKVGVLDIKNLQNLEDISALSGITEVTGHIEVPAVYGFKEKMEENSYPCQNFYASRYKNSDGSYPLFYYEYSSSGSYPIKDGFCKTVCNGEALNEKIDQNGHIESLSCNIQYIKKLRVNGLLKFTNNGTTNIFPENFLNIKSLNTAYITYYSIAEQINAFRNVESVENLIFKDPYNHGNFNVDLSNLKNGNVYFKIDYVSIAPDILNTKIILPENENLNVNLFLESDYSTLTNHALYSANIYGYSQNNGNVYIENIVLKTPKNQRNYQTRTIEIEINGNTETAIIHAKNIIIMLTEPFQQTVFFPGEGVNYYTYYNYGNLITAYIKHQLDLNIQNTYIDENVFINISPEEVQTVTNEATTVNAGNTSSNYSAVGIDFSNFKVKNVGGYVFVRSNFYARYKLPKDSYLCTDEGIQKIIGVDPYNKKLYTYTKEQLCTQ